MNFFFKYQKKSGAINEDIGCRANFGLNMKKIFRVLLCISFFLYPGIILASISDSLFSIKDADKRLMMVEYLFNRYDIKSREALQFKEEVLQKGNASEKLIMGWMSEDRLLNASNMDSSVAIFDKYLPAAQRTGNPHLLAILYSVKANALLYAKRYGRAFENYLYAYDHLKKDPQKKYYNQSWLLYNIAMNFYLFKDYAKTIEMTHELSQLPPPVSYSAAWFNCINYDLLAMAYLHSNRYDSALYWLDKTYDNAVKGNDTAWIGIAEGNKGLVYYAQDQYEKAIPYLETGINYCSATKIWDNVAPFATSLAHIYIVQNKPLLSERFLQQAKAANDAHYKLSNQLLYFNIASLHEKQAGNYSKGFELMDSVRLYEKKLNAEFEISKKALAESRVAYEKQLLDNALLQEKARNDRWQFYGLAVILILSVAAFTLFIKRQKLRYSLHQKTLQTEKLEAEKELTTALFEIKEFAMHITQKNKAIERLLAQVQHFKEEHQTISREEVEAIEDDVKQSAKLTEEGWADFNAMFEKAFPGAIAKFRTKLPELNDMERRYFKLLKLELSNREIAGMIGTDEAGISALRNDLVTKLELTDDREIEILLESL